MARHLAYLILGCIILSSCSHATATLTPHPITVEYTASSGPWLSGLYNCSAGNSIIAQMRASDEINPGIDIVIRIGQPAILATPAYQIGTEAILVVVNRITPVTTLSAKQVKGLFTGQITDWNQINSSKNGKVQVWVFPSGEDIEQVFEEAALGGTPVTSQARLANTPDEMSQVIANDENAIGIMPGHWKLGNVTNVFAVVSAPVLAITPAEPTGTVREILACLAK